MTALRKLGAITAILLSTACSQPAPPPSAIEQLADEYLDGLMEADALMGTYYSIAVSYTHLTLPTICSV